MTNSFWEEQYMKFDIIDFHQKILEKMEIPEWININCPFCNKKLPVRSIYNFGICLNVRNCGDIFVEVFCDDCKKMDRVYFRKSIEKISQFIDFINNSKKPSSEPILEENIYKMQYNNTLDKMLEVKKINKEDKI